MQVQPDRDRAVPARPRRSRRGPRTGGQRPLLPRRPRRSGGSRSRSSPDPGGRRAGPRRRRDRLAAGRCRPRSSTRSAMTPTCASSSTTSRASSASTSTCTPSRGRCSSTGTCARRVAYCFDKPATAEQATDGGGEAIYSEIPPVSWAYPSDGSQRVPDGPGAGQGAHRGVGLEARRRRDLREGRPPAVDGRRRPRGLSPSARAGSSSWRSRCVPAASSSRSRRSRSPRSSGCSTSTRTSTPPLPESRRPFDAYFGGFNTTAEPDPFRLYHSSECSSAERPSTFNYICYANAAVDRLIEAGRSETDPAAPRARSITSTRSPSRRTCRSSTPGPTSPARASGRASGRRDRVASTWTRRPGSSRSSS